MALQKNKTAKKIPGLSKSFTGIMGLDEITSGGIPTGRPTLICGAAGAGKTLMGIEIIINGAILYNEPGVIMVFEEEIADLEKNVASLGFDLKKLQKDGLIKIDHVEVHRTEIAETGEYDLDGLFIRLGHAIDSINAKRVMLDTLENLFAGLKNEGILRSELLRLFLWLKNKGVTAIITGEKGESSLTRRGLEEYVSDCVIMLDHRINNQISTRVLRIVKYRGSTHGTNEYPFLIDEEGISVLPVTSIKLNNEISSARITSGIPALDNMLSRKGFFRGSSILVSGTSGTGKTSISAYFVEAACKRKERCLYFAFEESPLQIVRNMKSININLDEHLKSGYLHIHSSRPTTHGLEMHLVVMIKMIKKLKPKCIVLDPITNLVTIGTMSEVKSILIRLIDFLQSEGITVMFTALVYNNDINVQTDEGISSLVDSWILLRDIETNGERNRGIYMMKSRGMKHSNQVREFLITDHGIDIMDVMVGPDGVLIGSARIEQQLNIATGKELKEYALTRKDKEINRKRLVLESKIASLKEEFESVQEELNKAYLEEDLRKEIMEKNSKQMSEQRSNKYDDKRK
jgi:circadian clock protein KaiC